MINSIRHFQEKGVKNLIEIFNHYTDDLTKFAEMVQGVTKEVTRLGLSIIEEELESYDQLLRERQDLRKGWYIERRDETRLLTSLGEIQYHKTYFHNRKTGEYCYLLDQIMGIEKHARISEDAEARILEEAVESSYRKGGINASIGEEEVSKETVMNKLHELKFPKLKPLDEKRKVSRLYIDADEDHVSLQYLEKKGDIKKPRINTAMPKLIYVYEDVDFDGSRHELKGCHFFGGDYAGTKGTKELWQEVFEFIESSYDEAVLERIYINGDGAEWIKSGSRMHEKAHFILDRFHMHKYIIAATSHLKDSVQEARSEIYRAINGKRKRAAEAAFDKILNVTESETKKKAVESAKNYILGNWAGIMESLRAKDKSLQCSAEGHVSHIYADRMSSRPLGWSRRGVDKMSRLRIYRQNKREMLDLVRYQKKELSLAAGAEEVIYSATQMLSAERRNREKLGGLADMPVYSIPYPKIKKIAALKNHIWGL
jgi:hypothetical protein